MKETQKPGQEKEKVLVRKRFILVGTLERYTARWNNGHELPGALVSEDEFRQLDTEKQTYYSWELKETYKKGDVWHFASELMDDVLARDEGITANTAAFYNPFWGDPVLYRNMILILLILSVSLMAYLMAVYYSGRRKFFLQLREIGASTAEVWRMAAFECVLSVLPAIVLALAIAYLFSLARALSTSPAVVLADEPTGNLDAENAQRVAEMFRLACDEYRQTIIMVSHDAAMADYADRIIRLKDGVIS